MKVSTRLTVAWALTAVLMLMLAAAGIFSASSMHAALEARSKADASDTGELRELALALERGHGAAYALALGDPSGVALRRWQQAAEQVQKHLQSCLNASAQSPQTPALQQLADQHGKWTAAAESLPKAGPAAVGLYWSELEPAARRMDDSMRKLRDERSQAAVAASQHARDLVWRSRTFMATMAAMSLFFMLWIASHLQRTLVEPLGSMAAGSVAIGTGEPHRRLRHAHDDELGQVARRVNDLADTLETLRSKVRQSEAVDKHISYALIERLPFPSALADGAGVLIASNKAFRSALASETNWHESLTRRYELRREPLMRESGQPVGELVEIVGPNPPGAGPPSEVSTAP